MTINEVLRFITVILIYHNKTSVKELKLTFTKNKKKTRKN